MRQLEPLRRAYDEAIASADPARIAEARKPYDAQVRRMIALGFNPTSMAATRRDIPNFDRYWKPSGAR